VRKRKAALTLNPYTGFLSLRLLVRQHEAAALASLVAQAPTPFYLSGRSTPFYLSFYLNPLLSIWSLKQATTPFYSRATSEARAPALVFYPFNPHTLTDLGKLGGGEGGLGSCRRVGVVDVCGAGHLLLVPGWGAGAFRGRFTLLGTHS